MNVRLNKLVAALTLTAFCFNITGCASNKKAEPNPSISGYEIAKPLNDNTFTKTNNPNELKKIKEDQSILLVSINKKDNIYKVIKTSKNYATTQECVQAYEKDIDIINSTKLFNEGKFKSSGSDTALIKDRFILKQTACSQKNHSYEISFETNNKETAKLFFSSIGELAVDTITVIVGGAVAIVLIIPLFLGFMGYYLYNVLIK